MLRWTSPNNYSFIAVRPENEYSSRLFFVVIPWILKNPKTANYCQTTFPQAILTLSAKVEGDKYSIFVDSQFISSVVDTNNPSGKVGYAYYNAWENYTKFSNLSWTDLGEIKNEPIKLFWLGQYNDIPPIVLKDGLL